MKDIFNSSSPQHHKKLLDLLSSTLPDMLWVKDLEGRYVFVNKALCEGLLMAKDVNEPIGKNDIFFAQREREKYSDQKDWHTFGELCFNSDTEVLKSKKSMRFEEYGNIKGKLLYLEVNKAPFYDEYGVLQGTVGSGRDITKYKLLQKKLEEEQYKLKESQRIARVGSWEIDVITGEATWSDTLYDIFNEDKASFHPNKDTFLSFLNEEDAQNIMEELNNIIVNKSFSEIKYTIQRKDKQILNILSRGEVIYNREGEPIKVVGSSMDITNSTKLNLLLKQQKEEFEYQANHDYLTHLPNRTLFLTTLQDTIFVAKIKKSNLAILFIDLDHFKEINDSLGHNIGDMVLLEIAKRIKNKIYAFDTLARLGGDEFAIILNNIGDINDVSKFIKSCRGVLNEPIIIDKHELHLTMSIGVSIYPKDGDTPTELLKNADTAMYYAKKRGRNRYWFYDKSLSQNSLKYLSLENEMYQGLRNSEFLPYFQPQIDLKNDKLVGMELLVRWQHPTRGLVFPSEFIHLAEKSGHIINLDRQVMNKAIHYFIEWKNMGLAPGILSMNLATQQLESQSLFESLKKITDDNACSTEYLELEVTESEIMKKPEVAIKKLEQLHDMGFQIAIDDFGTGYSSLSYLKKFPIDKLKIDRAFIKDIPDNNEDKEITKMIIGLCKILKIKVLAEGVETKEQKDFLRSHGCDLVQGYYYAKPLSAEDMLAYLKKIKYSKINKNLIKI